MSLIGKIYFPREILPLSAILTRTVDFFFASFVFIGLMIWYRMPVHFSLIYVPLLLIIQTLLALGMALLGASVSVFIRDISFALPLVLQIWMYITPVIYPMSLVPDRWRKIYALNPMVGIVDSYRRVVLFGEAPDLKYLGLATLLTTILCFLAFRYFKKLEKIMSDVL